MVVSLVCQTGICIAKEAFSIGTIIAQARILSSHKVGEDILCEA